MKIAVLGGSGHVGRSVIRALLGYGSDVVRQVVVLNRRVVEPDTLPEGDPRLLQHVVDMSSADALAEAGTPLLGDVDAAVSTMGVGSGKGPAELFRLVEVDLPSAFARSARDNGVRRAVLLTGVGSDINSTSAWMVGGAAEGKFFHFKGLVEKNFTDLGFPGGLTIFRPAALLGTSHVPAFVNWLLPMVDWMVPMRLRSIHIHRLAAAMASATVTPPRAAAATGEPGNGGDHVTILEGRTLFALLDRRRWQADPPSATPPACPSWT